MPTPKNKKQVTVYLTEELKHKIELLAKKDRRSLNNWIETLFINTVNKAND